MTDRAPIPAADFEAAIDRLDRDALAEFVGRLEATADNAAVDVDPPVVTVGSDGDRERILVAPDSDPDAIDPQEHDPTPTAIVVPDGSSTPDHDLPVRTTADLRQQLLYAVPPADAESIAEQWLNAPARSESYPTESMSTAASDGDDGSRTGGDSVPAASGVNPTASDDRPTAGRADESTTRVSDGQRDTSEPESAAAPDPADGPGRGPITHSDQSDGNDDSPGVTATRSAAGLAVVGVLVVMILAVTAGVVYAAEVAPDGDAGAFATAPSGHPRIVDADLRQRFREPIDGSGAVTTSTPDGDHGTGVLVNDTETNRNVRPVPTCERSFLLVVQIQMNALKYNNNTTDDGIRTVRRFASPRNRQTIETFEEFARVINSPAYGPMLSYESAQYTPLQSSDDYAQVKVTTQADGNTTGRYYFRLRKIDGGEYDGCWMTDAVVAIPEPNNFSGKVGGQTIGVVSTTS